MVIYIINYNCIFEILYINFRYNVCIKIRLCIHKADAIRRNNNSNESRRSNIEDLRRL